MAPRDAPARPQRWPWLLLAAGLSTWLPSRSIERAHARVEDLLLSARGLLGRTSEPEARAAEAGSGEPESIVVEALRSARGRVLPPADRGWQRDGRFVAVAVEPEDDGETTVLRARCALPPGEPVFVGAALVGFTARVEDPAAATRRILPLTVEGSQIRAAAGVPGLRETALLAVGESLPTLALRYVEDVAALQPEDLAWALDPPSPPGGALARVADGAWIGTIVRDDGSGGGGETGLRIEPWVDLARIEEVAVRFPPGFPAPEDLAFDRLEVEVERDAVRENGRDALLLPAGSESGVRAGCALSAGTLIVGRVVRSGWNRSLARTLLDPGFELPVLVLAPDAILEWELRVAARDGERVLLGSAPPLADWDGALVVTAADPRGCPEGLFVGILAREDGRCALRRDERFDVERLTVHRPRAAGEPP